MATTQALTPTALPGGGSVLNATTTAVSVSAVTGVTFANDGQSFLLLINGATAATATVTIAATVEGQGVTSIGPLTVPASATSVIGPFNADFSAGFGGTATVNFGTPTTLTVLLCHYTGTH